MENNELKKDGPVDDSNGGVDSILDEFEAAFREAAAKFGKAIPEETDLHMYLPRKGDFRLNCEREVYEEIYKPIKIRHNLFAIAEETYGGQKTIDEDRAAEQKTFLILDTLDGTVNALAGLTCGVSIAIGTLRGDSLSIGDINGVLVGDYRTLRVFRWARPKKTEIRPPEPLSAFQKKSDEQKADERSVF